MDLTDEQVALLHQEGTVTEVFVVLLLFKYKFYYF